MKRIDQAENLQDKKVIIRADWNVPTGDSGEILDTQRIEASKKTINYCLEKGASIIIISHFTKEELSIKNVFDFVNSEVFSGKCVLVYDPFSEESSNILKNLSAGQIAVIENIRKWKEEKETNEKNREDFAKKLAEFGDLYINEAFSESHREYASILDIPKFLPHFAGFHFVEEVENLSKAFNPPNPFVFILGGAKFETKLPLVEKFLEKADDIFILGALAFEASKLPLATNQKVHFPVGDIKALDANTETLEKLEEKINSAKFVLWNGPLGKYEDGYTEGTEKLATLLAEASEKNGTQVIVGGGDTLTTIDKLGIKDKFTFVSMAGGATLDFLANETLPGIEALK